ncbi:MAG: ABC transporter substrate-binding protein [Dehalococcoidia bacterium]|nr:ABC transporter substrate-binding protein [Dehalococcoidia bacterium]
MKKVSLSLGLFLTVVMIVTIFAGCTAAPQKAAAPEAMEKEKVTFRMINLGDASGAYAVTIGPQLDGCKDYAQWANENDYLPGAILDIRPYDHGLKVESAVALYKEAVTSTPIPVITNGGLWSTVAPTLAGFAKQNKIPIIDATSLREVVIPPGWFWGYQPSYEGQVGAYVNWIIDNWKADSKIPWIQKHYENRKPRLALVSWDIALGRANESVEARCYAESKGVEWVGAEYVPLTVGDVTPQLSRLKDKVDFIYIGMFGSAWQAVLKKAAELDMRDQFIDCGTSYFSPPEIAKFTPDLVNNTTALTIFDVNWNTYPKQIQDAQAKTKYPKEFGSYAVGWYWGDLATQALRKTIEKVGIENVTGQAIQDVLCEGGVNKFKPMISENTITWANNANLVKMDGGDSVTVQLVNGYTKDILPEDTYKTYITTKDVPVPGLLPGGKDIPAGCK